MAIILYRNILEAPSPIDGHELTNLAWEKKGTVCYFSINSFFERTDRPCGETPLIRGRKIVVPSDSRRRRAVVKKKGELYIARLLFGLLIVYLVPRKRVFCRRAESRKSAL